MGTFIIILISLAIGITIGIYLGKYHIQKEVTTVKNQNELLQRYTTQWGEIARSSHQLTADLNDNQNRNTTTTLHTIIQLIGNLEKQNINNQDAEEKNKIQQLINQAKSIQYNT